MKNVEKVNYLIIGNSAGGIGAAEAIREADPAGSVTIVSDEPYPAYSRPLIAEHLAEGCPLERILFRPADFYPKNGINIILGSRVVGLDVAAHRVQLADGRKIAWRKLLLATGGVPIVPNFQGADFRGVFTFTNLDDAKAIAQFINSFHNRALGAIVIGGGLIGVSAAEALVKRGVKVTIVEMKERILNTILDDEASAMEAEALKKAGVNIITGHTVSEVGSYTLGTVNSATLADGTVLPCNLVVVAVGVRPRLELVAEAGFKVNRGILVDRHMATSQPDVYACGDVAEAYDFVYGECRLTPIWPNAYLGGKTAGSNMAGLVREYPGGTAMNALKYFGHNIVSAGMVTPPDESYEVLNTRQGGNYRKVILKDGIIVGMVFVGDIEKSGIVFNLMKQGTDVSGFKKALVAEDFGLAALPKELWQRLEAPAPDLQPVA